MDTNEDQLDHLIGNLMKEHGHEQPPPGFTNQVLMRVKPEWQTTKLKHGPLMPVWSWLVIAVIFGMLVSGIWGGLLPNELAVFDMLNLDYTFVRELLPAAAGLEVSSPFVYGTLTLAFFVVVQIILLPRLRYTRHIGV
jgi:hypothetical protein